MQYASHPGSADRNCDGYHVLPGAVDKIFHWEKAQHENVEVAFKAARVDLRNVTGVLVSSDLAAMTQAVKQLGGDPTKINQIYPVDLVMNNSVVVDASRPSEAPVINENLSMNGIKNVFSFSDGEPKPSGTC